MTAARLATSTQRQNDDRVEVEAGREEEAAVRAGSWLARRGQPAATFCRRACLPKSESDSKCTEWAPPTVGRSSMGARRIQRAMKAQIAPPKVAVEARLCAWAGRATSWGERSRAAGLAPSAERCERPVARFVRASGYGWTRRAGGPAADCTAGRASGRQAGPRQAARQKSHSESVWRDPVATFNDIYSGKCRILDVSGKTAEPKICLLYTSPSPRDGLLSRMPSSA